MRYGVGIDLGTSFTSAAFSMPGGTRMVSMSPAVIVPSVAYRAPDGPLLTGDDALHPDADPRNVARNFKRRLGDPTPLFLGGTGYSPAELMAAQLSDVLATTARLVGGPPDSVVLTYPAMWGPYRREHFAEVPRLADVRDFRLLTEPEAAATHYSTERRLGDGEVIAVYDLGGGTFDTTILRMRDGRMEILGTPEGIEYLGGTDFDDAICAHLDERLDGAISELDQSDPEGARTRAAIQAMCLRAKEELSSEPDVLLHVPLPGGAREVTITRLEFNEMITPAVRQTIDALHRTTASAGLTADDLSAVLLAGGSSRVPLVAQLIAEEVDKPVRGSLHPKHTVALGAAQVSAPARSAESTSIPIGASTVPAGASSRFRRKWLVPGIAAAAVLLVGAAVASFITTTGGTTPAGAPQQLPAAPPPAPRIIYDERIAGEFSGFGASELNDWRGESFTDGLAQGPQIKSTSGGLRVAWNDKLPAQIYVQTKGDAPPVDLSPYLADGALVFDAVLHAPPTGYAGIAVHCDYPCGVELPATDLFRDLPLEKRTTVKIPLECFTEGKERPTGVPSHELTSKLDPGKVNTPFVVFSQKRMDVTFSDVRWDPAAATDPQATRCDALS
ncbi:Hsp70 family protein [Saccharopolyspora sp. NFXS83]|uniref:Hsp70 family protein n=1 Tax=Saccharopolyspora sp. NFXS83 TaxID=2993560 RepID=UPI00224B0FE4|nr:Hsp70 family protein [Saccharopolyspora sp. NFXS83]MCX2730460.1 Hsp70 family protein [Saccharopolyspora sp. NFXS83]